MRKTCAQAVESTGFNFGIIGVASVLLKFIHFLFTSLLTGFSQLAVFSTQTIVAVLPGAEETVSTVSTAIVTITKFYIKGSLITHRGIS